MVKFQLGDEPESLREDDYNYGCLYTLLNLIIIAIVIVLLLGICVLALSFPLFL